MQSHIMGVINIREIGSSTLLIAADGTTMERGIRLDRVADAAHLNHFDLDLFLGRRGLYQYNLAVPMTELTRSGCHTSRRGVIVRRRNVVLIFQTRVQHVLILVVLDKRTAGEVQGSYPLLVERYNQRHDPHHLTKNTKRFTLSAFLDIGDMWEFLYDFTLLGKSKSHDH